MAEFAEITCILTDTTARDASGKVAAARHQFPEEALRLADRVLILFQGKFIFDDVPEAMEAAGHPFIQSFLANPEGD